MLLKDLFSKDITKNTYGDKRSLLANAIEQNYQIDGRSAYSYLADFDDTFVYFEIYTDDGYKYFKSGYTINNNIATFDEVASPVVRFTEWADASEEDSMEKSLSDRITKNLTSFIGKHFGGSSKQDIPVLKQFNQEQMVSIEPLYIAVDGVDGVGDTYDKETCYGMVESLNKAIEDGTIQANYFHRVPTEDFTIVKAWITECECMIGDTQVPEGQPLVQLQFNSTDAWELRKSGDLMGVSIGARCTEIIEVNEE